MLVISVNELAQQLAMDFDFLMLSQFQGTIQQFLHMNKLDLAKHIEWAQLAMETVLQVSHYGPKIIFFSLKEMEN